MASAPPAGAAAAAASCPLVLVDELAHARSLRATAAPTSRALSSCDAAPASLSAAALLQARQAALAVYSGWLCQCAVPPRASLAQQAALGAAWVPRWVCLTREALHVWAPLQLGAGGAGGGGGGGAQQQQPRALDAGLALEAQGAAAAAAGGGVALQLARSVSLAWGSGACAEGAQDADTAAQAGTQWHLWAPSGAWAFRAASEGEAAAWVLHVSAVVASNRGSSAALRLPPLLLGQGDVACVAEAVGSAGGLAATGALRAHGAPDAPVGQRGALGGGAAGVLCGAAAAARAGRVQRARRWPPAAGAGRWQGRGSAAAVGVLEGAGAAVQRQRQRRGRRGGGWRWRCRAQAAGAAGAGWLPVQQVSH